MVSVSGGPTAPVAPYATFGIEERAVLVCETLSRQYGTHGQSRTDSGGAEHSIGAGDCPGCARRLGVTQPGIEFVELFWEPLTRFTGLT
jgi:hypothetical protein